MSSRISPRENEIYISDLHRREGYTGGTMRQIEIVFAVSFLCASSWYCSHMNAEEGCWYSFLEFMT